MKTLLILLTAAICSCTVVKTKNATGAEAMFASLGGDSKNVTISPDGAKIEENKNSLSFGKAVNASTTISGVMAAAGVAK